ncbi:MULTISPECIES: acyl-CoA dehydrogenase family protein [unclassified Sphingobium]|uniref:acyl-CoA dehydrogenase family protein n=1 Tax=unclassified Sphingobium TaxID=2611147 RepID=UPI000D15653E|nr:MULTISPECIES: acyl-CoA dehydrogenase family protein [unclassified Sphingobium]MBG6120085.1 acyl-CoA dehydrogenase [Sphingobium sp. JAI105]PSO12866.1 butyryl-CoA dehydrogenase [Sphingobium sp. AEW4]TWD05714.1 alkylation response protein AidB-like acyl-CoA dehydrogenase [Sphingobium sp. AEW010]TWD23267.1 alkylation response protein AidB-like acyl-CoA dehydrogenase [Sphingobium sp. AEW013]TWD25127.1 alkylation response protein AidB-like acyl-CoA dehydrogenase [Sphingobium sp. AEW001]
MTFAGFALPDDLAMLSDAVARFVAEEIRPVETALPPDARAIPHDVLQPLQRKAREAGYWCFDAPEEYGGGGLSSFAFVVAMEQASKHRFCFPQPGGGVFGHPPPIVMYSASPEQIERYVRPSIEQGHYGFTAIAEATGGSDPANAIRTTALRDGDNWVLNGTKMWITHGQYARYGVVYARTDNGISAFIVDAGTPGMEVTRELPVLRDHWPTEIRFDDCRIPAENLIGAEGGGLAFAGKWVLRARLLYAARAVGVAEEALRIGTEWARERQIGGSVLATRQATQFAIAESRAEINAARWLTWDAAWQHDEGRDARTAANIAKLKAVAAAANTVDRMMQIMGAMGMSREVPLEGWYRDLRVARILEGADEMLRIFIARAEIGPLSKTVRQGSAA